MAKEVKSKPIKIYKKAGSVIKNMAFKEKKSEILFMKLLKQNKATALIRKGNFSNELIWDGQSFMFVKMGKQKSFQKGLFLFSMVRKDAKNFAKSGKKLRMPKKFPVNEYTTNNKNLNKAITGTDLNHAYWRIAMNLGIISDRTYERGLDDSLKVVRLAALSTLGKGKEYFVVRDGLITKEVVRIGGDDFLDSLYKVIRYTCYKYMQQIKKLLKDDFIAYKTDCVYYVDTIKNRKMVEAFFSKKNITLKQLSSVKKTLHE